MADLSTQLLSEIRRQIRTSANQVINEARKIELNGYRQVEALGELRARLGPGFRLPPTRGWAASPDLLLFLFDYVMKAGRGKTMVIVEFGSGASTIVLAEAIRRLGEGRLISYEHDAKYAEQTSERLRGALSYLAEVRTVPLGDWKSPRQASTDQSWKWYTLDEAALPERIDLLIVDGPPGTTGPNARFPALPALRSRLSSDALVVLDDCIRAEERQIASEWAAHWLMTVEMHPEFEKGLGLLRPREKELPAHLIPATIADVEAEAERTSANLVEFKDNLLNGDRQIIWRDGENHLSGPDLMARLEQALTEAKTAIAAVDVVKLSEVFTELKSANSFFQAEAASGAADPAPT